MIAILRVDYIPRSNKKATLNVNQIHNQGNVISDGLGMANAMNSFFVNIGSMVEAKIPNAAKTFDSYMGERKNCELVIGDATWNEVNGIIKNLTLANPRVPLASLSIS